MWYLSAFVRRLGNDGQCSSKKGEFATPSRVQCIVGGNGGSCAELWHNGPLCGCLLLYMIRGISRRVAAFSASAKLAY